MPINGFPDSTAELPTCIPLFPLQDTIIFPRGELQLRVFEPRYVALVEDILKDNRLLGIIQPEEEKRSDGVPALAHTGCLTRITGFQEAGEKQYEITVTGICRFHSLREKEVLTPYRQMQVDWSFFEMDLVPHYGEKEVNRDLVMATLKAFLESFNMEADWAGIDSASNEALVNALCMMSPYAMREKQGLLEAPDLRTRSEMLIAITEMVVARNGGTDTVVQ